MEQIKGPISVFGATGLVGSEFCRVSKRNSHKEPRENRVAKFSEILYLISTTHNYHVFEDVHKDVDTNLTVLLDVLNNLPKGPDTVFNFISSWFVYGDTQLPATEESLCNPKGFYSITKQCAENLIISFCKTFGIKYRILRLCNIYGVNDQGVSKQKNALQFLINQFKNNEEVSLYHNGNFYRDYLHVTDVARAIELVIDQGEFNSIYNIGSGNKILFADLIKKVVTITKSESKITSIDPPEFHKIVQVKDFYMDASKLQSLGFRPEISIEQGLEELCH